MEVEDLLSAVAETRQISSAIVCREYHVFRAQHAYTDASLISLLQLITDHFLTQKNNYISGSF